MTNAPKDWDDLALECFGEIVGGGTPSRAMPSFWNGSIPWVTPTEITALNGKYVKDTQERITADGLAGSAARLLPVGSVVVTTRATLGVPAIAAVPLTTNQGFKSIIPNENTDSLFTYYQIQTLKPEMVRLASGTTFLEISKADFSRIHSRRPRRAEQSRIAALLDTVDEAIAETDAVIAKLRQVRAGLLHDLLTRGLDEHGQLRDPIAHSELFQDSPLGRIPRNWEIKKLAVACSLIKDGAHIPPKRVETGPFLLGVQNMIDDQLSLTDADTRVPWDFFYGMHRTWQIKPGDVLLAIVGATIGKVARVPINFEPFTLQRSVAILRGTKDLLENDYLEIFLRGSYFQSLVKNSSNATAQAGLYLGQIACLDIPLPKVEEQQLISKKIQDLGQEIRQESACLTKLVALKSGLMDDLLTGRVRVPENVEVKQ